MKSNQKELLSNCEDVVRFTPRSDIHSSDDIHRNRVECRTVETFDDRTKLIGDPQWAEYVKTIIRVSRKVSVLNTVSKQHEDRSETALYISNFRISAQDAAKVIREHWSIENRNHYVRDVSLLEDLSRIRVNPENMSVLRSFALNVLRRNKVKNVKGTLYTNSLEYYDLYGYQQFI